VTIGHLDGKGHHVAADGMLKPGFGIGIREFAHVSGMLKMVEDLWRVTQCGRPFSFRFYNSIMPEIRIPQRIVSLQPSITVTLRDLGLLDRLAACTKYCVDLCPELKGGKCSVIEDSWSAKAEEILAVTPDLVLASLPYRIESLAEIMKTGVPCLCLSPKLLNDVYADILHIARIVSSHQPGEAEARAQ
jgi:ABC-type hemin transport system substrate-binding protein